jgi:hypothetical protein
MHKDHARRDREYSDREHEMVSSINERVFHNVRR